jgi:hypothetical protein
MLSFCVLLFFLFLACFGHGLVFGFCLSRLSFGLPDLVVGFAYGGFVLIFGVRVVICVVAHIEPFTIVAVGREWETIRLISLRMVARVVIVVVVCVIVALPCFCFCVHSGGTFLAVRGLQERLFCVVCDNRV